MFETSPTYAQLVLGILRDAEKRRDPLPPAPHPDDDLDTAPVRDTGIADHEEESDDDDSDEGSAKGKREEIVGKLSSAGAKGKDGTRAKARKAWDKLGRVKEEVSNNLGRDWRQLISGICSCCWTSQDRYTRQSRSMSISPSLHARSDLQHMLDKLHISKDHKLISKALDHMPTKPIGRKGETPSSEL